MPKRARIVTAGGSVRRALGLRAALTLGAALALASALPPAAAAQATGRSDIIVLLDSSRSMSPYHAQVVDFVVTGVLKDYARAGDSFHLLSFSDNAQLEIAQPLRTQADVQSALARLYLLYPVAKSTDLVGALRYLLQYLAKLPEAGDKHIVLITDGMHSPPPGSSNAALDADGVRAELEKAAGRIRERGWTLRIVRVPFYGAARADASSSGEQPGAAAAQPGAAAAQPGAASAQPGAVAQPGAAAGEKQAGGDSSNAAEAGADSPSAGDYLESIASAAGIAVSPFDPADAAATLNEAVSIVAVEYPDSLGERERSFKLPLELRNPSSKPVDVEAVALLLEDGYDALRDKAFLRLAPRASGTLQLSVELPAELERGELSLRIEPRFSGGLRASPPYGTIRFTLKDSPLAAFLRGGSRVLLFAVLLVALLAIALLVAAYLRSLHRRASDSVVEAVLDSNQAADGRRPAEARAATGSAATATGSAGATPRSAAPYASAGSRASAPAAPLEAAAADRRESAQALLGSARPADTAAARAPTLAGAAVGASGARGTHYDAAAAERRESAQALLGSARPADTAADRAATLAGAASGVSGARAADRLGSAAAGAQSGASRAIEILGAAGDGMKAKGISGSGASPAPIAFSAKVKRPGTLRLSMQVKDQNPNVGKRNIKTMHAGGRKFIGGGSSDFLVFLYPTPRRVAELYFDGESLTFIPLRRAFFPDYDGPVENCLGEELRMVNARGRELRLRFERYVPPVESLNRLLHSIDAPGPTGEAARDTGSEGVLEGGNEA